MLLLFSCVKNKLGAIKFVSVNLSVPHIYRVNPECSVREHYNNIRLFWGFWVVVFLPTARELASQVVHHRLRLPSLLEYARGYSPSEGGGGTDRQTDRKT